MCLIMEVESFSFLMPIGIKKCGINIKKHKTRFFDGINNFSEFTNDSIELLQCILIHTIEEEEYLPTLFGPFSRKQLRDAKMTDIE